MNAIKPKKSKSEISIRNKIANQHTKLVHKIAHRMISRCNEPYDDLYQQGFIGLLKAVENFDPSLGNSFSSFAVPYIQGAIQHYLRDNAPSIKIPRSTLEKLQKIKRLRKQFAISGRALQESEIAAKIGISIEEWNSIQLLTKKKMVSWDELPYEPLICEELPEEDNSLVYHALSSLDSTSRHILLQKFFLGKDIREIARELNLDPQKINCIISNSLITLNNFLKGAYGADSAN